jgi:hypothetical protein
MHVFKKAYQRRNKFVEDESGALLADSHNAIF